MKLILSGVLLLVLAGCSSIGIFRPDATPEGIRSPLTVMTFNVRHGCGREDWGNTSSAFLRNCSKQNDDVIAAIRSISPDVVGLQETTAAQAQLIAETLDMHFVYASHNYSGYGSWWGNALLSRFEPVEARRIPIGGSTGRNRSMVTVVGIINERRVRFASIHIDPRQRDGSSIDRILHYVDSAQLPTVLIGDFNMGPKSPQALALTGGTGIVDSAGSPAYGEMGTWDSPYGRRIDYIFLQGQYFDVLNAGLVAGEYRLASDHVGYYATLEMRELSSQ